MIFADPAKGGGILPVEHGRNGCEETKKITLTALLLQFFSCDYEGPKTMRASSLFLLMTLF